MPSATRYNIGILPSLEILPFFEESFQAGSQTSYTARPSYGGIARDMLTGTLDGGILPWEIFISDVFSLPGQRTKWTLPFFPIACPTELILQSTVHKALYPAKKGSPIKHPARLTIGVESRNSLTKRQIHEWLKSLGGAKQPEPVFKFLPMDLMLKALASDVLDGFVAPSPWGIIAEEKQLGVLDTRFTPGKFAQQLVFACRNNPPMNGFPAREELISRLASARLQLTKSSAFEKAATRMACSGKPFIHHDSLAKAVRHHRLDAIPLDLTPDVEMLTAELRRLETYATLPPQIAANSQTATLLLPS